VRIERIGAALLLVLLAGCGGGATEDDAAARPADAAAGIEEEGAAKPAPKPQAPKPMVKVDESLIPPPGTPLSRETYAYAGGSRDPFASVLDGSSLGPELPDLDLVAIYYIERNPAQSVAVLRDRVTNKNYTVHEGERVGRARASDIRPRDVTFAIDDFGTIRQVTLSLRKQEGNTP